MRPVGSMVSLYQDSAQNSLINWAQWWWATYQSLRLCAVVTLTGLLTGSLGSNEMKHHFCWGEEQAIAHLRYREAGWTYNSLPSGVKSSFRIVFTSRLSLTIAKVMLTSSLLITNSLTLIPCSVNPKIKTIWDRVSLCKHQASSHKCK